MYCVCEGLINGLHTQRCMNGWTVEQIDRQMTKQADRQCTDRMINGWKF